MRFARQFRLQAVLCALALLLCELLSLPFTTMNVCDDGPFIRMAQTFAHTGHIVYNGWEAPMMLAQIFVAYPFIKLFGDSYTAARMSTLLLALVTTFFFHRTLVRTGSSERNATLGTLAVAISPMVLMLSATFMSDIAGLLAITLCLYGCVRAIQSSADRSAIAWLSFAVFACAFFGTSRQIAWLGDLVMVPCTLWLLRRRKHVLLAGALATTLAVLFIFGCLHWLSRQPYVIPVPPIARPFPRTIALRQLSYIVLEIPFLVLPIIAVFVPRIFKTRPITRLILLAALVAYVVIAFHSRHDYNARLHFEPTAGYDGAWVNFSGVYSVFPGAPVALHTPTLVILTIVCLAGLLGVIAVVLQAFRTKSSPPPAAPTTLSWRQLGIVLVPFSLAYLALLASSVGTTVLIFDRYALGLLGPTMIALLRLYQERVRPSLPPATILLILVAGAYGIIVTHNTFALDRARVDLANQLHAHGVPYTSLDGGWDYNFDTELDHATYINSPLLKVPADAYIPPPPDPPGICHAYWQVKTPHVHPLFGVSFLPNACYGRAPFAPVQYRPWPFRTPHNLYAVRYAPPTD